MEPARAAKAACCDWVRHSPVKSILVWHAKRDRPTVIAAVMPMASMMVSVCMRVQYDAMKKLSQTVKTDRIR
jgi:hypothetical protein